MPVQKGRFYFKLTTNGNLLGEYGNAGMNYIATESSIRENAPEGDPEGDKEFVTYEGIYRSCWLEGKTPRFARLQITLMPSKQGRIFNLEWTRNRQVLFKGEAMLCDNILVGYYE